MDKRFVLPQGVKNYSVGAISSLVSGIAMYVSRMVFIRFMRVDYVGYSSIFEYIFLLVSALDFGVATSLMNFMSRALNTQSPEKMNGALKSARRIYLLVSFLMMSALFLVSLTYMKGKGLFMPSFVYFLGQAAQYYLGWRVLALNAMGRNDIVSLFIHGGKTLGAVLEIVAIITTGNYLVFISVSAFSVFLSYLLMHILSKRICPWISEKSGIVEKRGEGHVMRSLPAMACHRFGTVFFRSYEIIAVNVVFGYTLGGKYANLVLISSAFMTLFWVFQSSVTGIMGGYYVSEGRKETMGVYKKMTYLNLLFSFLLSGVFLFSVKWLALLSFGEENYLSDGITLFLSIEMFLLSSRTTALVVRDALGDYSKDWWKPLLEALSTIILTLFLISSFSYSSVSLSISLTLLFISVPVDNFIVSRRLEGKKSLFPLVVVALSIALTLCLFLTGSFLLKVQ